MIKMFLLKENQIQASNNMANNKMKKWKEDEDNEKGGFIQIVGL